MANIYAPDNKADRISSRNQSVDFDLQKNALEEYWDYNDTLENQMKRGKSEKRFN
jgi:hypothetical protein